jgi:divalent metal cation (Fe/Co/Zn/Cd) transporter
MSSPNTDKKTAAIRLSLFAALALAMLKLAVGFLTNSVAILSLAVDSLGDVLSSSFNLSFVKQAGKPADADHHFGHGKFENVGSFIQGIILVLSAGFVIFRAFQKLRFHEPVYQVDLGLGTIVVCFVVSFFVGRYVQRVGKERWGIFDPIASLCVAGYILVVAFKVLRSSFDVLTDKTLTEAENEGIVRIINDHYPTILGYDRFGTRLSGAKKFISFRLFLCKKISLGQAHDVIDHIEKEIQEKVPHSEVMTHAEPAKEDCSKHEHTLHPRHFS